MIGGASVLGVPFPSVWAQHRDGVRHVHTMRSPRVVYYNNPEDWIEYVPPPACSMGSARRLEYVRGEGLLLTCGCGVTTASAS